MLKIFLGEKRGVRFVGGGGAIGPLMLPNLLGGIATGVFTVLGCLVEGVRVVAVDFCDGVPFTIVGPSPAGYA